MPRTEREHGAEVGGFWFLVGAAVVAIALLVWFGLNGALKEDPSASVATTAAVLAAGVVAWQSYETRRSARASELAAQAANDALDVARREEGNSRDLLRESIKARIDTAMPNITVTLRPSPETSLYSTPHPFSKERNRLPLSTPLRSRHSAMFLVTTYRAEVNNDTDQHVSVSLRFMPVGGAEDLQEMPVVIEPRGTVPLDFELWNTFSQWLSDEREPGHNAGGTWVPSLLTVTYDDPADTGAVDTWTVEALGSPLVPIDGAEDTYTFNPFEVRPRVAKERYYFRSRRKGQDLDD